mgnify:FL=1
MREMKDSGIEWIGTIPFDWKCCKQKYEIQLINGRAYSDSEFEEDGKYRILRVGNLFSNPTWYTSSLELPPDKYCENGDLLYSWSMSYAPVIWSGEKVIYHYHIWKTKLSSNLNKKFAYYYLSALTDALKAKIHETTMGFITMGVMNNSYIAFPCLKEQEKIVSFLDSQCSEIDAISADIQKEIETLEQYKRSVITEAVTKGLNPDVEMKDSGIEWVGNIPVHWDTIPIRYLFAECRLKNILNQEKTALKFTYGTIIKKTNFDSDSDEYVANTMTNYTVVYPGTIMINGLNLNYDFVSQRVGLVKDRGAITSAYLAIVPGSRVVSEYANYQLKSWDYAKAFHNMGTGVRKTLDFSELGKKYFVTPSIEEQSKIVAFLDSKCKEIEAIIASKKQQLTVIDSYKKSLIYEYVTGKKEVPNEQ